MLKVTVAEVRRDIIKQMGVDLTASMNYGTAVVNFNNSNPFTAQRPPARPDNGLTAAAFGKRSAVGPGHAARDGKRGRGADAGGAEPDGDLRRVRDLHLRRRISDSRPAYPARRDDGHVGHCVQTVSFKKFGISLNFTPVVLTEGRISLRVMTEVSEVSTENALTRRCQVERTIPSIKTRRAETTLEIPSGGSMAMAGLIQEQTKQAVNGLPGLDAVAGSWRAVPEPGLRQPPDRTDGARDALCRAGGGPEGAVASR